LWEKSTIQCFQRQDLHSRYLPRSSTCKPRQVYHFHNHLLTNSSCSMSPSLPQICSLWWCLSTRCIFCRLSRERRSEPTFGHYVSTPLCKYLTQQLAQPPCLVIVLIMSLQCGHFSLASKESGRSGKNVLLWLRVLNSSILVVSTRPRKLCKISSMVSSGVGPASQLVCMLLISWMIFSD
jgi:hypothetical protein